MGKQMKDLGLWVSLGLCALMFFSGCESTGQGMQEDFADAIERSRNAGGITEENTEENTEGNTGTGDAAASEDTGSDKEGQGKDMPGREESEKETQNVGNRLLSFYGNTIVGEENGRIVTLAEIEELEEENYEKIVQVISYNDDILYMVKGQDFSAHKDYVEIRSVKNENPVIRQMDSASAKWAGTEEGLFIAYSVIKKGNVRYRFSLLQQTEDGSYVSGTVYDELEKSVNEKELRLIAPEAVHGDLLRDGVTYAYGDGKGFRVLNGRGEIVDTLETSYPVAFTYPKTRTDKGIIFNSDIETDGEYAYAIWYFDFASAREICLYDSREKTEKPEFMACEGDKIYYNRADDTEFEHMVYRIYSYDLGTSEERLLYTCAEVPGNKENYMSYTEGFAVSGGRCLFMMAYECGMNWYQLDTNAENRPENTGLTIYDFIPLKYGDISYESVTVTSETIGQDVYRYYVEKLQLSTKDAGTEAINRTLEELFESELDIAKKQADTAWEMALEMEDELGEFWICNTYMNSVSAIHEIGTQYYAIDFFGYEYWGGAHGYPNRSYYLLERSTGKNLTISDIYGGTEEEFKDVVARYTVEDWKREPHNYYGWEDEKDAYDDLYANARFAMQIKYGEEGIAICYSPYEYGPYAVGFIEVEIPYEALGLEGMLE